VKAVEDTWVCDAGCNGVVCVTVEKKGIDPVEVLEKMWDQMGELVSESAIKQFQNKHKFLYRVLPLQVLCRSVLDEMLVAAKKLITARMAGADPTTFSVVVDVRSNNSMTKMDVIIKMADLVQEFNPKHTVQLYMPETIILVQVVKAACGLSVVRNASRYCKSQKSSFNLQEHATGLAISKFNPPAPNTPVPAEGP